MSLLFICNVFLTCFLIIAIHTWTRKDHIFGLFQKVVQDNSGDLRSVILEAVSECLVCMSSVWSFITFAVLNGVRIQTDFWTLLPVFLVLLSAVSESFWKRSEAACLTKIVFAICYGFLVCRFFWLDLVAFLFFVAAVSGTMAVVERVLLTLDGIRLAAKNYSEQSIDQARAVEEICKAIKSKNV